MSREVKDDLPAARHEEIALEGAICICWDSSGGLKTSSQ